MGHSKHDATDSAAGYYFQAMFGLLVLLDAPDGHAVSIETADDIEKTGPSPQLIQLKHSLDQPPALTERNDGLWNTFSIWIPHLATPELSFIFVTCAAIAEDHALQALTSPDADRSAVQKLLEDEARRVVKAVSDAAVGANTPAHTSGTPAPFRHRIAGCRAFLALSASQRHDFVRRTVILHKNFNLASIETAVAAKLSTIMKTLRVRVARRLTEWWDCRVARSLAGVDARTIERDEVLQRLFSIMRELDDDALTDDFGLKSPDDLSGLLGSTMELQIRLVGGGDSRVQHAALARWRARSQRDRWLSDSVGVAEDLRRYDQHLIEYWHTRHGPLRDDCAALDDGEKRRAGLDLWEWAFHQAPKAVPPPRPRWTADFLTQGSYQQLAEEVLVGWHPDFLALLESDTTSDSTPSIRPSRSTAEVPQRTQSARSNKRTRAT